MRFLLFVIILFCGLSTWAQQHLVVEDSASRKPLPGISVMLKGVEKGAITDSLGRVTLFFSVVTEAIISHIGYESKRMILDPGKVDTLFIYLSPEQEVLEDVQVSSTRSRRNIADIPTRIETVTGEELAEKAVMQPGNVRMLLTESTGIQTQQTSATSSSSSIRIHGLEGRYTLLLKDGYPLYSGFSSGLSVLQIPPLDLKRVELVKGSASTLYGGGAIAGLVNFISKEPEKEPESSAMLNLNQTGAVDASAFHSSRGHRWGTAVYVSYNGQKEYDNNNDTLSDIPHFRRFSFNPKIFYFAPLTTIQFGLNGNIEDRRGGDMLVLEDKGNTRHQYFEENNSTRLSTIFKLERSFGKNSLTLKNSVSYFLRQLKQPQYLFEGDQVSTFTELTMHLPHQVSEWVAGLNLYSDQFQQDKSVTQLEEKQLIAGAFVQNNLKVSEKFFVEAGLRTDNADHYRWFVLPRISLMYKFSSKVTSRIGGGLGYKLPTIFTEESEERGFKNISPINNQLDAETSEGLNWDVNYREKIGEESSIYFNQLFFITRLHRPVILNEMVNVANQFTFHNANGIMYSRGFETNIRFQREPVSFSLGYTFINAQYDTSGIQSRGLLTARHRIYFNTMYELEDKLRIAYELFYTGPQYTTPSEKKRGYWVTGISAERKWEHFSLFFNAENFTDTRQSRFESLYTGTITQPQFKPIWSHTEGVILNGGVRLFL
jgi:outer membrane receptor for ferrienterochelin and colicins